MAAARRIAATLDACGPNDAAAFAMLAQSLDKAMAAAKHYRNERENWPLDELSRRRLHRPRF
ncbi:MAG TPA: hypothetical protein VF086_09580 [Propionibacteriaceae bacterium]